MAGQAEGATPGDAGLSSSAASNRTTLADELETLADTLIEAHRRLTHSFPKPDQDAIPFWKQGIEKMIKYVKDVDRLRGRCDIAYADETESEHGAYAQGDMGVVQEADFFDDAEDNNEVDVVSETLDQLNDAVELAVEKINAAIDAVGGSYLPGIRSQCFREAAAQLPELSSRCVALAVQMRGPAALEQGEDA